MPTILKIGYTEFLMKSDAAAVKALSALAGAIALESTYEDTSGRRRVFWPDVAEYRSELSIMTVRPDQLVRSKPMKSRSTVDVDPSRAPTVGGEQ